MRVLALGGAGGMGGAACAAVARQSAVSELVVADRDVDRAMAVAGAVGARARGIGLDVSDGRALARALADADVVMNTVGPFFRFGVPVLTAAIAAGCHYVDICDDWEPTLDMLGLTAQAEAAGVTALIGMGATPGVSNLLAVLAAAELDTTTEIITGWNIDGATSEGTPRPPLRGEPPGGRRPKDTPATEPSAALVHGIAQITGTIRVVRDGRPVDERPLRRVVVDYPGVGRRTAWTFGHPEPVTLPRAIDGVGTSLNVAFGRRSTVTLMKALQWSVDHRVLPVRRATRVAAQAERRLTPSARGSEAPGNADPGRLWRAGGLPPLFALATGLRDGRPASAAVALCRFPGTTMSALTGIPLAVALGLLAGGPKRRGVFAPEDIVEPRVFFAALAAHCLGDPSPDEMTVVTRSWDEDAARVHRAACEGAIEVIRTGAASRTIV